MRMRPTVICGLSGSSVSFHIISYTAWFSGNKKKVIEHKIWIFIFYTILSEIFLSLTLWKPSRDYY